MERPAPLENMQRKRPLGGQSEADPAPGPSEGQGGNQRRTEQAQALRRNWTFNTGSTVFSRGQRSRRSRFCLSLREASKSPVSFARSADASEKAALIVSHTNPGKQEATSAREEGGHPQRRSDSQGQPVTARSSADRNQSADGSVLGRRKFRAGGQGGGGGGGVGRAPSSLAASPTFRLPRTVNQNRGKPRSGLQAAATTSTSSTAAARAHHKHVPGSSRGRLALVAAAAAAAQAGPARVWEGGERKRASRQPALARSPSFLPSFLPLSLPPRLPSRQKAPLAPPRHDWYVRASAAAPAAVALGSGGRASAWECGLSGTEQQQQEEQSQGEEGEEGQGQRRRRQHGGRRRRRAALGGREEESRAGSSAREGALGHGEGRGQALQSPVKQEEMAALDVDSGGGGPHGEYLQQGNGASAATSADASDEAGTTQDTQPSPLALLAATCSKIGPPSPEEDDAASPSAGATGDLASVQLAGTPNRWETLTLGQVAAGGALTSTPVSLSTAQLPNLQTVTINSIDSGGIQLHPGDNADSPADIRIKEEEPDPEEWQLGGDSTLNTNDLTHLRVQVVDEEGDQPHQEGKRLRRVACTCPNCKEGGGRGTNLGKKKQHICHIPAMSYSGTGEHIQVKRNLSVQNVPSGS
ncbi:transcription factor Sp3 [Crotalus adamanteus]|uniref:Transcription factor Sp3 n=1 Tax=Crotalus adamanteus TaxID=8729 RepID=A0AAW1CAI7_CROAD